VVLAAHNNGWQVLVESNRNVLHRSILDSTRGIFFFGTPHQGLRTSVLEDMVDVDSGVQRSNLITQLKEGSEFLENQADDLLHIWPKYKGKIVSFYETVMTPPLRMVSNSSPAEPKCTYCK